MTSDDQQKVSATLALYPQIRAHALSGAGFQSMIAFLVMGGAAFLALSLSMLWALDMAKGAGSLYAQFSYLIYGGNPSLLVPWLSEAVDIFLQARGNSAFDMHAWLLLLFICALLFAAHFSRYDKPGGESLLLYPEARGVAEQLLQRVGYFVDIWMPIGKTGEAGTDFFGMERIFYAPRAHLSRLLKGKRSDSLQKRLTFFMVHECAHAVTRDNLANSAFVVIVALLSFMFFMIFSPLLVIGSAMLAMTPMGANLSLPLSIVIFVLFSTGVYLTFRGLIVSYIKAREFYADQAAFRFVGDAEAPYGFSQMGQLAQADAFSALRTGISPRERAWHQQGYSLHARDMLIYFWGIFFSIRTLFVLVAPKDLCWTVLGVDVIALAAFVGLYVSLPRRPPMPLRSGGMAWLLTFLTVLAVEACGPGLIGSVMMLNRKIFSDFNAQLIGLPGLVLLLVFLFGGLIIGAKRLLSFKLAFNWNKGQALRRFVLFSLAVPGAAAGFLMIIICGIVFCVIPLNYFLRSGFSHAGLAINAIPLLLVMAGSVLLFHQYLALFVRKRRLVTLICLVEGMLFCLFFSTLSIAQADVLQGIRQGVVHSIASLDRLPGLFATTDWSSVLPFALLSTSFYLGLRLLAFWAQDSLMRTDIKLVRESSR
ncbi:M48 family metalloprotease [uncultured Cohaesibacter sp.]|uniref:M48 family metalloprotease n=1 Tax=uncultured Cohaesibacter sp. TaxID=1002546 RepID=UPI0029C6D1F8|nr:M48 family metalloprotease [uncultured Cohaesibacter sp.]